MRLGGLFASAGLICPEEYENIEYTGVVTDSRRVTKGSIFVAVRGYNNDGHRYISQAIKNGASVIVAEQVRDWCVGGAAIILVESTLRASVSLYNAHYGYPWRDVKITAVTGTNGKTSVAHMLESIFLSAGIPCALLGTLGCCINGKQSSLCRTGLTTPPSSELYPLLAHLRDVGVKHLFMEVSSHALAQGRVSGIEFECGIYTGLSRDHLDFHGTMENYFLAKASLFEHCKIKIFNADDEYASRLSAMYGGIFASRQRGANAFVGDVECTLDGTRYKLEYKNKIQEITLGALGDFSVSNSSLAALAAYELGLPSEAVAKGLSRALGAKGRMERLKTDAPFDVIIDFAHTPDALYRLITTVKQMCGERRIVTLFGCGGNRDRGKRKQMGAVSTALSDLTVITSDNPRDESAKEIISDILKGIDKEKPYKVIEDRREAIEYVISTARAGDVILLCGKGHETYIIDNDGERPFDERETVREVFEKGRTS